MHLWFVYEWMHVCMREVLHVHKVHKLQWVITHACNSVHLHESINHGRRLRGGWGDGPSIFFLGGAVHASVPQYFEKYCYRMWGKVRTDKKKCQGRILCSEIEGFLVKKRVIISYFKHYRHRNDRQKLESITKKRSTEILGRRGGWGKSGPLSLLFKFLLTVKCVEANDWLLL